MKHLALLVSLLAAVAVSGCTELGTFGNGGGASGYGNLLSGVPVGYQGNIIEYCETFWAHNMGYAHYCVARYGYLFSQEGGCVQGFEDRHEQFCDGLDSGSDYLDYWNCVQDSRYAAGIRQCGYIQNRTWDIVSMPGISIQSLFPTKEECLTHRESAIEYMEATIDRMIPAYNNSVVEVNFLSQIRTWACNCSVMSTSGGIQMHCADAERSVCKNECSGEQANANFKAQQEAAITAAYGCDAY